MSHRAALIFLLRDSEWHSMRQCMEAGGYRYGGRLHELRKDGFAIETRRDGNDLYSYRWNRSPKQSDLFTTEET